jgi:hypothetical protein
VPDVASLCPHNDHHATSQIASGDKAIFAVIVPNVLFGRDITHEHQPGVGKIQPSFLQGDGPLGRVKADVGGINISH